MSDATVLCVPKGTVRVCHLRDVVDRDDSEERASEWLHGLCGIPYSDLRDYYTLIYVPGVHVDAPNKAGHYRCWNDEEQA